MNGTRSRPPDLLPPQLAPDAFRCAFNARSSFGAHSYLMRRPEA